MAADARKLDREAPLVQAVKDDELDTKHLETQVETLRSSQPAMVSNNYCLQRQTLFDDWPDLSDPDVTTHPGGDKCYPGSGGDWKHTVARRCHTLMLEAAARNECRFCMLLVQQLRDAQLLDLMRRIEACVDLLGEPARASLSLQNWGQNADQLMWVNWPGKVSEHCNDGICSVQQLVLAVMPAGGEWFTTYPAREIAGFKHADTRFYKADVFDKVRDPLDTVTRWLDDCSDKHPECANEYAVKAPTRLLCISDDQVRLISTSGSSCTRRYATLSYR